jgi:hypothetical protein
MTLTKQGQADEEFEGRAQARRLSPRAVEQLARVGVVAEHPDDLAQLRLEGIPRRREAGEGRHEHGRRVLLDGPTRGIFENSQQVGRYIRYAQEERNAWHVDAVAHSMGGLITRHYVHHFMPPVPDGRPQVAHLPMFGVPSMGSPCADVMDSTFEVLGKNVTAGAWKLCLENTGARSDGRHRRLERRRHEEVLSDTRATDYRAQPHVRSPIIRCL